MKRGGREGKRETRKKEKKKYKTGYISPPATAEGKKKKKLY